MLKINPPVLFLYKINPEGENRGWFFQLVHLQLFHHFYWTFQDQKYLNRQKCPFHVIWVISITHMCPLCKAMEFFLNEAEIHRIQRIQRIQGIW